jgi:hypothetical protein
MVDLLYLVAYVALPIGTFLLVRSVTWTVAVVTAAVALVGAFVTFWIEVGNTWTFASLQAATLVALLGALVAAVLTRRGRTFSPGVTWRHQFVAIGIPFLAVVLLLLVSRLAAGPRAGFLTAVGFLVRRQYAEDNAKWLDFTGQLVTGDPIVQGVSMGGPLQLFLVIVATALAAASLVILGGVNEVFVAANSVVYAQFFLAAMVPFALSPLAEARIRRRAGSSEKGHVPVPLLWTGMLVLVVGVLAASGLGHLTLEFVLIATAFWVAVFLIGSRAPHAYALSSLAVVAVSLVWFPLLPVSLIVMVAGAVALVVAVRRARFRSGGTWVVVAAWVTMVVLTWSTYASTLRYITDTSAVALPVGGMGGGVRAGAGPVDALVIPALELLSSQGGTEQIAPALGVLVVLAAVLATMYVVRRRETASRWRRVLPFLPALLLGGYAVALSVLGTWWAGDGPAYGALKTTFMASIVILAVATPLALMEIDRGKAGTTLVRGAGMAAVIYLLTIDSLMPRAFTYISPQQWPDATGDERGYWWPAEVRSEAEQTIASLPISCAYRPQGAGAPSALPNGQTAYSCTRLLVGLSGADTTAQGLVDWQRREWLTNTPAWDNEYQAFLDLPENIRAKNFILMDEIDRVIGLDSVQYFMDRYKPPWAQEAAGG